MIHEPLPFPNLEKQTHHGCGSSHWLRNWLAPPPFHLHIICIIYVLRFDWSQLFLRLHVTGWYDFAAWRMVRVCFTCRKVIGHALRFSVLEHEYLVSDSLNLHTGDVMCLGLWFFKGVCLSGSCYWTNIKLSRSLLYTLYTFFMLITIAVPCKLCINLRIIFILIYQGNVKICID